MAAHEVGCAACGLRGGCHVRGCRGHHGGEKGGGRDGALHTPDGGVGPAHVCSGAPGLVVEGHNDHLIRGATGACLEAFLSWVWCAAVSSVLGFPVDAIETVELGSRDAARIEQVRRNVLAPEPRDVEGAVNDGPESLWGVCVVARAERGVHVAEVGCGACLDVYGDEGGGACTVKWAELSPPAPRCTMGCHWRSASGMLDMARRRGRRSGVR